MYGVDISPTSLKNALWTDFSILFIRIWVKKTLQTLFVPRQVDVMLHYEITEETEINRKKKQKTDVTLVLFPEDVPLLPFTKMAD